MDVRQSVVSARIKAVNEASMNAKDWQQVKDIFAEVLEQSNGSRLSFLREKCGADEKLFLEIKSLLDANAETEPLIEKNALQLASQLNGKSYDFTKFGRYTVLREIGRGGMGAVFLAERNDGEYEQKAALKIIRQSFVNEEIERHFRRERQILASLNHPNIAKLLDGGVSETGELFLVMEYVEGESLLEYAENHQLNIEDKLYLFLKICRAVSFAHQNLVVHRDLKPSNILVAKSGEPKLLDFGLAKITAPNDGLFAAENGSEQTKTLFRAFTPAYASPEQIHGKTVTTASDVYSLGVVLYELLTGEKPFRFEGKSLDEILKTIDFTEPPRPSAVGDSKFQISDSKLGDRTNPKSKIQNPKFLKGDLDNITLKALRKEPPRRYKSVEAFADDIERHLKNLPVRARPNTLAYRASRFFRRNRIAVSATALVILALISGLAIALRQTQIARVERVRAEQRFSDVRQLSNSLLFELSPKIERLPGSTEAREILVSRALEYLDSLATESQNDASLQSELAGAYEKIGDLQGNPTNPNLIDLDAATKSYEKANEMRRNLLEKNRGDSESERKLAENHRVAGNIYSQTNEIEASAKNTNEALQIYEKLVAENPSSSDLRFDLAKVNYDFGLNLQSNKKHSESLAYFEKAKNLLEVIDAEKPNQPEVLRTAAEVKIQNANALSWAGRQTEAEKEADEAIKIYEKLFAENPNDVSVRGGMWLTYWLTSGIYQDQNDQTAYEYALKALKVVAETVAQDGANIRAKQQLAKSYSTLGETATTIGKSAAAIAYLEKACQMLREITDSTAKNNRLKSELALSLRRLGSAKAGQELLESSLENLRQAENIYLEILRVAPEDRRSNRNLADVYEQFGLTYGKLYAKGKSENERQAARANFQKALDILARLDNNNSLAEADRKFLNRMKTAVEKYQK